MHGYFCTKVEFLFDLGSTPAKRGRPKKSRTSLADRYPTLTVTDAESSSYENNIRALSAEMESEKPRKDVYLPLMKRTFLQRREFVLTGARSVAEILQAYPALKLSPAVCYTVMCNCQYIY